MKRLIAPFGITIRRRKIAYCNQKIIPLLIERGIEWDMSEMRIIFCGRRFPMKYIDDGKAEEFINNLVKDDGQSTLTLWE